MKIITAILLTCLLLTQVFSKWLVILEYNVNKEYIANNLCINKEKPVLKCEGKCQLMKKLAEQEESNDAAHYQFAKASFSEVCFDQYIDCSIPKLQIEPLSLSDFYTIRPYNSPTASIFHPPSQV